MWKYDNKYIKMLLFWIFWGIFCLSMLKMYLWLKLYTVPFFVSGQTYKISKGLNNYCSHCIYTDKDVPVCPCLTGSQLNHLLWKNGPHLRTILYSYHKMSVIVQYIWHCRWVRQIAGQRDEQEQGKTHIWLGSLRFLNFWENIIIWWNFYFLSTK